jgi:hypothetical protein
MGPINQCLLNRLPKSRHVMFKFYKPRLFTSSIILSHQLAIIIRTVQLNIKLTLKFVICF